MMLLRVPYNTVKLGCFSMQDYIRRLDSSGRISGTVRSWSCSALLRSSLRRPLTISSMSMSNCPAPRTGCSSGTWLKVGQRHHAYSIELSIPILVNRFSFSFSSTSPTTKSQPQILPQSCLALRDSSSRDGNQRSRKSSHEHATFITLVDFPIATRIQSLESKARCLMRLSRSTFQVLMASPSFTRLLAS